MKTRSTLTIIGLAIATTSILIMIGIGYGIRSSTYETFARTGSLSTVIVEKYNYANNSGKQKRLTDQTVNRIIQIPGVESAMPMIVVNAVLKSSAYVSEVSLLAFDDSYDSNFISLSNGRLPVSHQGNSVELVLPFEAYESFHQRGSYFTASDVMGNPKVNGHSRLYLTLDLTEADDPQKVEEHSPAKTYGVTIVGQQDDQSPDFSFYTIISKKDLGRLIRENQQFTDTAMDSYDEIYVRCVDYLQVKTVKKAIEDMGYSTTSMIDAVEAAEKSTEQIQITLGIIGGVSVIVAAIGIMNTMLMSIMERKKEIGIFKVIGCSQYNILELFITEAVIIGVSGGVIGILISYIGADVINTILDEVSIQCCIPGYISILAAFFSVIIAVLAGIYPSYRALQLTPLSSIRNE